MTTFTQPAKTIERDRFGRPLILQQNGADAGKRIPYTRVTTVAGSTDDKTGLMHWRSRLTALGLTQRRDLYTAIAATDPEDKRTLNRLAGEAADHAGATAAATTGTAIHTFTERHDRGEPIGGIPDEYKADLDAYAEATKGWDHLAVEQFLVNHTLKTAGTTDRVVRIGDEVFIADLKTGSSVNFPHAWAIQLAIYSRSLRWDEANEHTIPWDTPPSQEKGIVIHLPAGAGKCDLYWVDLEAGWEAARLAFRVREWRARRDLLTPYTTGTPTPAVPDPVAPPAPDTGDWLLDTINNADSETTLNMLWRTNTHQWTDQHTEAAKARKDSLRNPAQR